MEGGEKKVPDSIWFSGLLERSLLHSFVKFMKLPVLVIALHSINTILGFT